MNAVICCKDCHNCFEPNRHTIQEYNFVKVDDVIQGDYDLKCPHCGTRHLMVFEAQITDFQYWKD